MRRQSWKYGMLGALIVIAVLYGIELTSQGLADVYGPLDRGTPLQIQQQDVDAQPIATSGGEPEVPARQPITELGSGEPAVPAEPLEGAGAAAGPLPAATPPAGESSVNRLADGTAGLLQSVTSGGIRLVVSMFEAITD